MDVAKITALAFLAYNVLPVLPVSAHTEAVIYNFNGKPDGFYSMAGLISVNGTLYGTTASGGTGGLGTIFNVTQAGIETVLYSFDGTVSGDDGMTPEAPLLQVGGALYGTTTGGGVHRQGTVFEYSAQGEQIVYSFGSHTGDGIGPATGLIEAGGALYGTTSQGGEGRGGTVFKLTLSGQETVLHSFGDCAPSLADGCGPVGRLLYVDGALYGTTSSGGTRKGGVVYRLNGTSETILYSFGIGASGENPRGGLIDVNGVLYGTTSQGGKTSSGAPTNAGTVYSIDPSGTARLVYTFGNASNTAFDGALPVGELLDVNGTLYGDTEQGGAYENRGTAYALLPDGSRETVLCSFTGQPMGSLIDVGGRLYGTTYQGGTHNRGSVFDIAH